MATQRTIKGAPVTVRWQPTDGDGVPADPGGTVTVSISRADGTAVVTDAATTGATTAERTYVLAAASNLLLDLLTVTWKVATVAYATTTVEVVGGFFFGIDELIALQPSLGTSQHSNAAMVAVRKEVEEFFEDVCHGAFFPKYAIEYKQATASGFIDLAHKPVLRLRSIRRTSTYDTSYTDATTDELALIQQSEEGWFTAPPTVWYGPLTIGYEHGLRSAPPEVKRIGAMAALQLLNSPLSGLDDRATGYTDPNGTTITIAQPGVRGAVTSIPKANEVLSRWAEHFRKAAIA